MWCASDLNHIKAGTNNCRHKAEAADDNKRRTSGTLIPKNWREMKRVKRESGMTPSPMRMDTNHSIPAQSHCYPQITSAAGTMKSEIQKADPESRVENS